MDAIPLLLAASAAVAVAVLALAVLRGDGRAAAQAAAGASAAALLAVGAAGTDHAGLACLAAVPLAALWLLVAGRPGVRGAGPAEAVAWVAGLTLLAVVLLAPVQAVLPGVRVAAPEPGPAGWALCAVTAVLMLPVVSRTLREWRLARRDAELVEFAGAGLLVMTAAALAAGGAARPAVALAGAAASAAVAVPSWVDLRRLAEVPRDGGLRHHAAALGGQAAGLADGAGPAGPLPVAWLSVATGERLGMAPGHLGRLAREAVLHDLGKRGEPGVRAAEVGTGASLGGVIFAAQRYLRLTRHGGLTPAQALEVQRQDPDGVSPAVVEALEAALESGLHMTDARPAPAAAQPVPVAATDDEPGRPG